MKRLRAEEVAGEEWAAWYALSPSERFLESTKLWETYLALGGSLEPEPDTQSLSSIQRSGARVLLMGGQACVFYGAAEFSRDLDLLILADPANLANLMRALDALGGEVIAVPRFEQRHLLRGHAVHLRCHREDVVGVRIDLMSTLRGVAGFDELWNRRTTIEVAGEVIDLLAMQDLVRTKETQCDKDWPMIRRLVEQSYFGHCAGNTEELVRFWLRELRTPELLVEVAGRHPGLAYAEAVLRPAVQAALASRPDDVRQALEAEEREQRRKDRGYWAPLKRELEEFRLARRRG